MDREHRKAVPGTDFLERFSAVKPHQQSGVEVLLNGESISKLRVLHCVYVSFVLLAADLHFLCAMS